MLKRFRQRKVLIAAAVFFCSSLCFYSLQGPPSVNAFQDPIEIEYNCCRDGGGCSCQGGYNLGAEGCFLVFCICWQQGVCVDQ